MKMILFNNIFVFCLDDSIFGHNYKQQITDVTLIINEYDNKIRPSEYAQSVCSLLSFFKNLKHMSIVVSSIESYAGSIVSDPCLSSYLSSAETFFTSTLMELSINVREFNGCL